MSEKRFKYKESENEDVCGIYTNRFIVGFGYKYRGSVKALCNLLNQLNDENKELKEELNELNIPIDEIKDTISDARGRTVGVYYND